MKKQWYKIIKLAVILGLMMGSVLTLQAQELLNIEFSSAEGYVDGELVAGQPEGAENQWMDLRDAFSAASQLANLDPADLYYIDNEQLVVLQNGGGASWVIILFPVQTTGVLTLTWDWQYVGDPGLSIDVGINLSDTANYSPDISEGSLSVWGRQTTSVRMAQSGIMDVRCGDTYSALESFDYRDGSLIHMRYIVNLDEKSFDVYAQKEGEDEVALGIGCGFRRDVLEGIDHLSIWESGSETTECHIDNIVLTASTGEPSSAKNWDLFGN